MKMGMMKVSPRQKFAEGSMKFDNVLFDDDFAYYALKAAKHGMHACVMSTRM